MSMSTITATPATTPANGNYEMPPPIKPDHEIKITLKDGFAVGPSANAENRAIIDDTGRTVFVMAVGERVRYSSDGGEVRIQFPQLSPFRTDELTGESVPGSTIMTLVSGTGGSIVKAECFITPPGGKEVGYNSNDPNNPNAGVHHRVTPP